MDRNTVSVTFLKCHKELIKEAVSYLECAVFGCWKETPEFNVSEDGGCPDNEFRFSVTHEDAHDAMDLAEAFIRGYFKGAKRRNK